MKNSKRAISLLIVLCMVLTLMPISALAATTYDSNSGPVKAYGTTAYFVSDVHAKQERIPALLGEADPDKNFAFIAIGGDYEDGQNKTLDKNVVDGVYENVDAYYGHDNMPVMLIKGNHEVSTTDEAFHDGTGWPAYGNNLTLYAGEDSTTPLVYVYSLSWGADGVPDGGTYNATELTKLDTFLSGVDENIPVFVVSHLPLHFLSSRRSATNAGNALAILNKYPNVVFCWGHNHTEADPMYTQVLEAGDVIQYSATESTEILFTYCGLGSLRANGHLQEMGFAADFSELLTGGALAGKSVPLTYYHLVGKDGVEELKHSDFELMDEDTTINFVSDKVVTQVYAEVARPLVGEAPSTTVTTYSDRYDVSNVSWSPADPTFNYGTEYTVSFELTAKPGFSIGLNFAAYVNGEAAEYNAGVVSYTFEATPDGITAIEAADDIDNNASYAISSDRFLLTTDLSAIDSYVTGGQLTTAYGNNAWTAYFDKTGYLLYNGSEFLVYDDSLSLTASPEAPKTCDWNVDSDGYLNVGGKYLVIGSDGAVSTGASDSDGKVQLFKTEDGSAKLNVVYVEFDRPFADNAANTDIDTYIDDVDALLEWDPDDETFRRGESYTASITVEGDLADDVLIRANGETIGEYASNGSSVSFEITYEDIRPDLPELSDNASFVEASELQDGGRYLIVKDGYALVANMVDGVMESQWVDVDDLTQDIYPDMLWTAEAGKNGFALGNDDRFIDGSSGSMSFAGDKADWTFEDGQLKAYVAAGGPGGPPPGGGGAPPPPPPMPGGGGPGGPPPASDYYLVLDGHHFFDIADKGAGLTLYLFEGFKGVSVDVTLDKEDDVFDVTLQDEAGNIIEPNFDGTFDVDFGRYEILLDGEGTGKYVEDGFDVALDYFTVTFFNIAGDIIDQQMVLKGETAVQNLTRPDLMFWQMRDYTGYLVKFSFDEPITRETCVLVTGVETVVLGKLVSSLPSSPVKPDGTSASLDLWDLLAAYDGAYFTDVSSGDWFYRYVTDLTESRIINGYPDGSFRPGAEVTWGEALKLVMKAVGHSDYEPAPGGHWASGFMAKAISELYITGEVDLDAPITRTEMANLVANAMRLAPGSNPYPFEDDAPEAAVALYAAGIITGSLDNGHLLFRGDSAITRAEMAAIIWRVYHK